MHLTRPVQTVSAEFASPDSALAVCGYLHPLDLLGVFSPGEEVCGAETLAAGEMHTHTGSGSVCSEQPYWSAGGASCPVSGTLEGKLSRLVTLLCD